MLEHHHLIHVLLRTILCQVTGLLEFLPALQGFLVPLIHAARSRTRCRLRRGLNLQLLLLVRVGVRVGPFLLFLIFPRLRGTCEHIVHLYILYFHNIHNIAKLLSGKYNYRAKDHKSPTGHFYTAKLLSNLSLFKCSMKKLKIKRGPLIPLLASKHYGSL